jgi:hypothetical protein
MVEALDTGVVEAHVVDRPASAERFAVRRELVDKI